MNRVIKAIINVVLKFLFLIIKDTNKRAATITVISKALFSNKNSIEYDAEFKAYWLKSDAEYLFIVQKPIYNFSKKNLYKSIEYIYCKNYTVKQGDVVVDVGAGIGTETLFFREKVGIEGLIYSIEASKDSFQKLNALCSKNHIQNAKNFNLALSNFNGKIWIEETDKFEVNQVNLSKKGIEVECNTLDKFVEDQHLLKINFLKVNIEGAELQLIEGMEKSIHIIDNIAVSCHDFLFNDNRRILQNVVAFLEKNGFEITYNNSGNQVTDSWIYAKRK